MVVGVQYLEVGVVDFDNFVVFWYVVEVVQDQVVDGIEFFVGEIYCEGFVEIFDFGVCFDVVVVG